MAFHGRISQFMEPIYRNARDSNVSKQINVTFEMDKRMFGFPKQIQQRSFIQQEKNMTSFMFVIYNKKIYNVLKILLSDYLQLKGLISR